MPVVGLQFPAAALQTRVDGLATPVAPLVFVVADLAAAPRALEVKESKTEIRLELAADVLFDFDKADLKPAAQETLQKVAAFVRENARGAVRIEGHTDGKGADAYNQKLSERRAASVKDWLAKNAGAKGVTYQTQGFGAKRPVAPNAKPDGSDDPEGRQRNRRVELVIKR
jgi:outer membrane protein OmpA-like peptidoglycan-associated protein